MKSTTREWVKMMFILALLLAGLMIEGCNTNPTAPTQVQPTYHYDTTGVRP